jgi:hypothetical protein
MGEVTEAEPEILGLMMTGSRLEEIETVEEDAK